jgi:hypothetical protein
VDKILKCNHFRTDLGKSEAIEDHSSGKVGDFSWNGVGLEYEESTWNEGVGAVGTFHRMAFGWDIKSGLGMKS